MSAKYYSGSQQNNYWTRIGLRLWIVLPLVSLTLPAFAQVSSPTTPDIPSWTLCREPVRSVVRRVQGCGFQIASLPDKALCHKLSVFTADPKSQKNGSRGDRAFAPTNVDARTKLKGVEREPRNAAVFAAETFLAKRQLRAPAQLLLRNTTVRRAHNRRLN